MKKEFTQWNNRKTSLDVIEKRPYFHEGDIWTCALGVNIGFEQDGRGNDFLRPVLVIRKFNQEIFWGIPFTKTVKSDKPYLYNFTFLKDIKSTALLSQLRLIDARRLSYSLGKIQDSDFKKLIEKLKELFP